MAEASIRIRTWVRGSADDERAGLVGFLSVTYGDLVIDGITVRRTAAGRLALSFPERTSRKGQRHSIVAPVNGEARQAIEAEVFRQAQEVLP